MGLGHRKGKCSTYYFFFQNWFDLKMSVNDVMDVGDDFICLLNKKNKMFCKDNINNMARGLPKVYNLLLMLSRGSHELG